MLRGAKREPMPWALFLREARGASLPRQVAAITPHLPAPLEKIGVFVDASYERNRAAIRTSGLTGVQLHSQTAPDLPAQLRDQFGPELRILRVVHFGVDAAEQAAAPRRRPPS